MRTTPSPRWRLIFAGLLAVLVLAACGGGHPAAHPTASATTQTASTPSAITTAFNKECTGFDSAYSTIQSATQGQTTVGQLMATLTGGVGNTASGWSKQLGAAAKAADAPGVPTGRNKARGLALDIDEVAVAVDKLQLIADLNKLGKIPGAWTGVLNSIDAVRSTGCS
jgi:hypothetical protein